MIVKCEFVLCLICVKLLSLSADLKVSRDDGSCEVRTAGDGPRYSKPQIKLDDRLEAILHFWVYDDQTYQHWKGTLFNHENRTKCEPGLCHTPLITACISDIDEDESEDENKEEHENDPDCKYGIEEKHLDNLYEKLINDCEGGLKLVHIAGKGRGVITTRSFTKGEYLLEYSGILHCTPPPDSTDDGVYFYYFTYNDQNYEIDATAETGRLGRLLNHSINNPNCESIVTYIHGNPYLVFFALRDIEEGEEVLFDYNVQDEEYHEQNPWYLEA